jgi:MFS superfamily sulfate permease-like transporter
MTIASLPVLNKQTLAERVELLVQKEHMRYSEAVVHVCDEHGIDPIDVAKMILTSPLKTKIEKESIQLNTVKGRKRTSTALL